MANQVEVEVVLSGAEEAKRGLSGIGETAGAMAERFSDENSKLGEGLSSLTDNVGDLVGSVKEFGEVATTVGKSNRMSFLALVPAVGAVAGALYALYETYLNISGAAEEAEKSTEAMAAAASDLESKLESLAEKGVIPAQAALDDFIRSNIKAQFAKEMLQNSVEKLRDEFEDLRDAELAVQAVRKGEESFLTVLQAGLTGVSSLKIARDELTEATAAYNKKLKGVIDAHAKQLPLLDDAAKKEKHLEETSAEATLARVKENIATLETLRLRQAEIDLTEKGLKLEQIRITATKEAALLRADKNKEDAKALAEQEKLLKEELARFNQSEQISALRDKRLKQAEAEAEKSSKRAIARIDSRRVKELAIERQKQADLKTLRQLELQQMAADGATALQIATERYRDELTEAQGNQEKGLIAAKRYQLALTHIEREATAEREQIEAERMRREAEQRKQASELAYSSLEFDLQMMSDGIDKELALLEMRYARERELKATSSAELNELDRREAAQRAQIIQASNDQMIDMVGEFTSAYGAGIAEAAYQSLLFGDSFTKSVGQMLVALGQQSAVQSLIEAAKGTAALFVNPAQASGFFKASAMFAGAAVVAGATGKAMGGGGGASSGGGGGATPSGSPTQVPAPQREEVEQSTMVFNVNFGGAVIYDTQRAAEQAMADRITTLQNTRRRGAPRRSF